MAKTIAATPIIVALVAVVLIACSSDSDAIATPTPDVPTLQEGEVIGLVLTHVSSLNQNCPIESDALRNERGLRGHEISEVVPENWTVGISGIAALRWHHDAI